MQSDVAVSRLVHSGQIIEELVRGWLAIDQMVLLAICRRNVQSANQRQTEVDIWRMGTSKALRTELDRGVPCIDAHVLGIAGAELVKMSGRECREANGSLRRR